MFYNIGRCVERVEPGNPYWRERLSTVDLLIRIGCFVKLKNVVSVRKAADMSKKAQGGQPYWSFPFSKDSLVELLKVFEEMDVKPC